MSDDHPNGSGWTNHNSLVTGKLEQWWSSVGMQRGVDPLLKESRCRYLDPILHMTGISPHRKSTINIRGPLLPQLIILITSLLDLSTIIFNPSFSSKTLSSLHRSSSGRLLTGADTDRS